MTLRAGLVDGFVMQIDPIGVEMRVRFDPTAVDLDFGHQILWTRNNGDGMAEVTLEAHSLVFRIKMFTVMAAEATR